MPLGMPDIYACRKCSGYGVLRARNGHGVSSESKANESDFQDMEELLRETDKRLANPDDYGGAKGWLYGFSDSEIQRLKATRKELQSILNDPNNWTFTGDWAGTSETLANLRATVGESIANEEDYGGQPVQGSEWKRQLQIQIEALQLLLQENDKNPLENPTVNVAKTKARISAMQEELRNYKEPNYESKANEVKIERSDGSMKIDGKNVIKIWESFSGWYWYAIEDQGSYTGVDQNGDDIQAHAWYGYVQGMENEWGTWDSNELERAGVWTVPKSNWGWTGRSEESKANEDLPQEGTPNHEFLWKHFLWRRSMDQDDIECKLCGYWLRPQGAYRYEEEIMNEAKKHMVNFHLLGKTTDWYTEPKGFSYEANEVDNSMDLGLLSGGIPEVNATNNEQCEICGQLIDQDLMDYHVEQEHGLHVPSQYTQDTISQSMGDPNYDHLEDWRTSYGENKKIANEYDAMKDVSFKEGGHYGQAGYCPICDWKTTEEDWLTDIEIHLSEGHGIRDNDDRDVILRRAFESKAKEISSKIEDMKYDEEPMRFGDGHGILEDPLYPESEKANEDMSVDDDGNILYEDRWNEEQKSELEDLMKESEFYYTDVYDRLDKVEKKRIDALESKATEANPPPDELGYRLQNEDDERSIDPDFEENPMNIGADGFAQIVIENDGVDWVWNRTYGTWEQSEFTESEANELERWDEEEKEMDKNPLEQIPTKDYKYEDGYDLGTMRAINALRDTEPHETGGFDWQEGGESEGEDEPEYYDDIPEEKLPTDFELEDVKEEDVVVENRKLIHSSPTGNVWEDENGELSDDNGNYIPDHNPDFEPSEVSYAEDWEQQREEDNWEQEEITESKSKAEEAFNRGASAEEIYSLVDTKESEDGRTQSEDDYLNNLYNKTTANRSSGFTDLS